MYLTFLIASTTPVIIFLYLIFRKDANPEPWQLLARCFFGGFLSVLITLLIALPLELLEPLFENPSSVAFFQAFLQAAIPEEFSKWIIFYWLVMKSHHFDEHYDGIQYAVFISLGFALVENIMYVFDGGLSVAVYRGVLSVPGHGFFAVLMGYFLSLARFGDPAHRTRNLYLSLIYPIVFHGMYNFFLMYSSFIVDQDPLLSLALMIAFTITVIYLWRLGFRKVRKHLATDQKAGALS